MLSAREFQARMRDHSLDLGDKAVLLPSLATLPSPLAAERLNIHRNNTMIGLGAALADAYPVVARLVGEECFDGLARAYASTHPPRQAPLFRFGAEFPAFLGGHAIGRQLPYLADVARLEAAWLHAYHAAETTPLEPAALASVKPECLGEIRFGLHPSHRFLASAYPVLDIWNANQQAEPPHVSLDRGPCQLLVIRPFAEVMVLDISRGALSLLMSLAIGQTLEAAWECAMDTDSDFSLDTELGRLMAARVFTELSEP